MALITLRVMDLISEMGTLAWSDGRGSTNEQLSNAKHRSMQKGRHHTHRGQPTGGGEAEKAGEDVELAVVDDARFVVGTTEA